MIEGISVRRARDKYAACSTCIEFIFDEENSSGHCGGAGDRHCDIVTSLNAKKIVAGSHGICSGGDRGVIASEAPYIGCLLVN